MARIAQDSGPRRPPTVPPGVKTVRDRQNYKLRPSGLAELVAAYQSGTSIKALARQFDLHEQTVRAHLVRAGATLRQQMVLTPGRVVEIAQGYEAGSSLHELAIQFGVSDGSIRNYLLRAGVKLRPARRIPRQAASTS